jgi:hypothetical protein
VLSPREFTTRMGGLFVKGESLNLDFHSVPYFGGHPQVQSHYLSKRSRRQPSILTFLAQDADSQVFCYSNADIRKGEEAEEIFRFIAFWQQRYGSVPQHLVFDSKLTTYDRLDRLDDAGITFITLRRRAPKLLAEIAGLPPSAWRTVKLDISSRKHRTPRYYEVRFFHIDALSSSVGFKVDFDMALLILASGLYRLMGHRMRGYDDAQARQIFRDLIDMPANIAITATEIRVRFHRRSHLPIVLASGLIDKPVAVPWWNGRKLRLVQ